MKVTLYTREECAECRRVWKMLSQLAAHEKFDLQEAASPAGAPAPCLRFDSPGSPFYRAARLTEAQFTAYLNEAKESLLQSNDSAAGAKPARPARVGGLPTAAYEETHPVRSFMWRHRVGALILALSAFVGLAWIAPLTPSWGWGTGFYDAVYSAYRLVCDQIPARSGRVAGLPTCLCWRCTAIYLGALIFGILYTAGRDRRLKWLNWLTGPVSLRVMLLYGLPLIIDGSTHALGLRPGVSYAHSSDFWLSWEVFSADWWLRIFTALLATVGAVKFLCPRLDKLGFVYEQLYRARTQSSRRSLADQTPDAQPV